MYSFETHSKTFNFLSVFGTATAQCTQRPIESRAKSPKLGQEASFIKLNNFAKFERASKIVLGFFFGYFGPC
jgi:hypothetical protein